MIPHARPFIWEVPEKGYEWRTSEQKQVLTGLGPWTWYDTTTHLDVRPGALELHAREGPCRHWLPFREGTGLFRTLADTAPTADGVLAFANRFGCLGQTDGSDHELLLAWQLHIGALKVAVSLWDVLCGGEDRELRRWF